MDAEPLDGHEARLAAAAAVKTETTARIEAARERVAVADRKYRAYSARRPIRPGQL